MTQSTTRADAAGKTKQQARIDRSAEALRANLRRRKQAENAMKNATGAANEADAPQAE